MSERWVLFDLDGVELAPSPVPPLGPGDPVPTHTISALRELPALLAAR